MTLEAKLVKNTLNIPGIPENFSVGTEGNPPEKKVIGNTFLDCGVGKGGKIKYEPASNFNPKIEVIPAGVRKIVLLPIVTPGIGMRFVTYDVTAG